MESLSLKESLEQNVINLLRQIFKLKQEKIILTEKNQLAEKHIRELEKEKNYLHSRIENLQKRIDELTGENKQYKLTIEVLLKEKKIQVDVK
jgi:uncharacterized protein YlxW (UPF0749 family)